jgi:sigma-B regulation protein RsbU (phosphoserine phosphatase)
VVDAENAQGQEYDESRLLALCQRSGARPAAETLAELMAEVRAFVGDAPRHDDLTCLILRRSG